MVVVFNCNNSFHSSDLLLSHIASHRVNSNPTQNSNMRHKIFFDLSPIPAMSETASIDQQKQHLNNMMKKLHTLIKKLPSTLPYGTEDGLIAKHFTERVYDITEGPYFTFNQLWEHVFQLQNVQIEHLVIHGKHGLDLIYSYISHFPARSNLKDCGCEGMVEKGLQQWCELS